MVFRDGRSDLSDREGALTHGEPGVRTLQPKIRKIEAGAHRRGQKLITLVSVGRGNTVPWVGVDVEGPEGRRGPRDGAAAVGGLLGATGGLLGAAGSLLGVILLLLPRRRPISSCHAERK